MKIFMNMPMALKTLGLEYKHNGKISSEKFLLSIVQVYYSKNAENSTIYPAGYGDFIFEY